MGLKDPRILYGVHSISPYRRNDKMPYGILKVIGSANLALSAELDQLFAGSNKFAWAAESKTISTELTAKVKAYPGFLFELFLGATVTEVGVDSAGTIAGFENVLGATVKNVTNGISSIAVSSANKANLKFSKYVLVAVGATTVNLHAMTDIDFKRGTDINFEDDTLKLNAAPITIATGSNVQAAYGIDIVGVGTPNFTVGHTAVFEVKPPSTSSTTIVVGSAGTSLPNFGAVLLSQKRATGEMFEIEAFNCVGSGLPMPLEENSFSQPELKMSLLYDSVKDAVFTIRTLLPETP